MMHISKQLAKPLIPHRCCLTTRSVTPSMAAQHPHHPVKPPPLGLHSRFAVQKALLEWIATHGKAGHMPKPLQLESTSEGAALLRALAQADGSVHALAARLRLQIAPEEVDWDCSWIVEQEILKFIELHQLEAGAMPTQACFVALGREDLHLAMSPKRWGRKTAFMHRLNLSPGRDRPWVIPKSKYWLDIENIRSEMPVIMNACQTDGLMPNTFELRFYGYGNLADILGRNPYNGIAALARELNIPLSHAEKKSNERWSERLPEFIGKLFMNAPSGPQQRLVG